MKLRLKAILKKKIISILRFAIDPIVEERMNNQLALRDQNLIEHFKLNLQNYTSRLEATELIFELLRDANIVSVTKNMPTGFNLKLNTSSRLAHYVYANVFEEQLLDYSRSVLHEGDVFLDVGSNFGLYAVMGSLAVGKSGKVIAFEPTPDTIKQLNENLSLNNCTNVVVEPLAIGDSMGEVEFNQSTNGMDAWNSIVKLDELSESVMTTVPITTLDNYIDSHNVDPGNIKLIKIDVEGWEVPVIKGADRLLKNHSPILLVEFTDSNAKAAGYSCQELYKRIEELGYNWYELKEGILVPSSIRTEYPYENLIALKD